jgi:ribokinase
VTAAAPRGHDVVVVGSVNHDLGIGLDRTPQPGETVLGDDVVWAPGGKGANQAVGCARLGLRVALVGAVGRDASGEALAATLASEGVDLSHLARVDAPTGLAVVLVDRAGESTIVVSPGANAALSTDAIDAASPLLEAAGVVLCQLEVPVETVQRAADRAGGIVVLNPAPAQPLPAELLERVDVLVPNRHELAHLVGAPVPTTAEEVAATARQLRGPQVVVVTLGADGALVVEQGRTTHVAAVPVTPVDTTAAGDSFCAALAAGLLAGQPVVAAVTDAVRVAAVTTLRRGALHALPRRDEVEPALEGVADGA